MIIMKEAQSELLHTTFQLILHRTARLHPEVPLMGKTLIMVLWSSKKTENLYIVVSLFMRVIKIDSQECARLEPMPSWH